MSYTGTAHVVDCISRQHELRTLHVSYIPTSSNVSNITSTFLSAFLSGISSKATFTQLSLELDFDVLPPPPMSGFDRALFTPELRTALGSLPNPNPPQFHLRIKCHDAERNFSKALSERRSEWMPRMTHATVVVNQQP